MAALNNYLEEFKSGKGENFSHTKIADKVLKIYGGVYNIEDEDKFMSIYEEQVEGNIKTYLTEKQLSGDQKRLYVDIDLRYSPDVKKRLHTPYHITDLIYAYLSNIEKLCVIKDGYMIDVYVMEKSECVVEDNCRTKDGIHLCFGISMNSKIQEQLRLMTMENLKNIWEDLPLVCEFKDVIDEGIVKGSVNCQMYGSRKPNKEAYKVTSYNKYTWNLSQRDWRGGSIPFKKVDYKRISVRNKDIQVGKLKDDIVLTVQDKPKKTLSIVENKIINNESDKITDQDIEIAKLMNVKKYLTDYPDWIKTMWALKTAKYSREFAIKLSEKVADKDKFDLDKLLEVWDSAKEDGGLTKKTIYAQARESDEENYLRIIIKYFPEDIYKSEEYSMANILLDVFGDNLVYYRKIIMIYTNKKWYQDEKLNLLKVMISRESKTYYAKKISKLWRYKSFLNEENPEFDIVRKNINILTDISILTRRTNWKNNIASEMKNLIMNKHQSIEFDANGNTIAFENKKYNFITKEFEDIKKEDYISFSTGYDWVNPEPEKVTLIKNLVDKIFPNEHIKKCYLSVMRQSLLGFVKQHFTVANGSGGNGKGLLNELLMNCVGDDYGYNGNLSVLVDKIKGDANPAIANIHKKRLVIFKEPNEKDKIQLGNLKQLVDNESCNARGLYQSDTKTQLLATFILECNKRLNFSGSVDESEYRRFIDVEFESTFTFDKELLNNENLQNVYEADEVYKQIEFKKSHSCALFKYLITTAEEKINIPSVVKLRTKLYVDSNDPLLSWVDNKYVRSKNAVILKISDMYNAYLNSDEYDRLHKCNRPTKKEFIKSVKENKTLKMSFKERHDNARNILLGWRELSTDELHELGIQDDNED